MRVSLASAFESDPGSRTENFRTVDSLSPQLSSDPGVPCSPGTSPGAWGPPLGVSSPAVPGGAWGKRSSSVTAIGSASGAALLQPGANAGPPVCYDTAHGAVLRVKDGKGVLRQTRTDCNLASETGWGPRLPAT